MLKHKQLEMKKASPSTLTRLSPFLPALGSRDKKRARRRVIGPRTFIVLLLISISMLQAIPVIFAQQNSSVFDRLEHVSEMIRRGELKPAETALNSILSAQPLEAA
jgi:hypothetical protein